MDNSSSFTDILLITFCDSFLTCCDTGLHTLNVRKEKKNKTKQNKHTKNNPERCKNAEVAQEIEHAPHAGLASHCLTQQNIVQCEDEISWQTNE